MISPALFCKGQPASNIVRKKNIATQQQMIPLQVCVCVRGVLPGPLVPDVVGVGHQVLAFVPEYFVHVRISARVKSFF